LLPYSLRWTFFQQIGVLSVDMETVAVADDVSTVTNDDINFEFPSEVSHTTERPSHKRRIFDFFNVGIGSAISARVVDTHFLYWKLRHPGANFSDYYAGRIADSLRRGGTHKTLGDKAFLSGSLTSDAVKKSVETHQKRGGAYFDVAINHGLKPYHNCIDYGCGSLRVGQHFIDYLDAQKYTGIDVVSDFYDAGISLLKPGVIEQKQPRFAMISPATLEAARLTKPDFIFSFAVLKHVPPDELNLYFRSIVSMMTADTTAVITFNPARKSTRTGGSIWNFRADDLIKCVRSIDPHLVCSVTHKPSEVVIQFPKTVALSIRRG
jgi:hypothetical protein